jgi:hypothetical protein
MLKIFWEMLKSYRLFVLIAVTFLVEAIILLGVVPNVVQNEKLTIIELIIKNTTQLSVLMMVTTFIYLFFVVFLEKSDNEKSDFAGGVTRLPIGSLISSSIPIGISLILCVLTDMRYIKYLSGVEISIGFIGIALMSITVLSIYKEVVSKNDVL